MNQGINYKSVKIDRAQDDQPYTNSDSINVDDFRRPIFNGLGLGIGLGLGLVYPGYGYRDYGFGFTGYGGSHILPLNFSTKVDSKILDRSYSYENHKK